MFVINANAPAAVSGIPELAGTSLISVNAMRPFIDRDGRAVIQVNGKKFQVNAALLQYDEWKDIDRRVMQVTQERLTGVSDLIGRNLVHPLGSIGNLISMYERQSDIEAADVSMSGTKPGAEDTPVYDNVSVPVPIIHKDFRVNIRRLEASRKFGEGIDVTTSDLAARKVAEKSEDILFAGSSIQVDGATIVGYTTHANRNVVDTTGQNWSLVGTTGAQIVAHVAAGLAALRADGYFGPYVMYVPSTAEGKLDSDYSPGTSDNRTIRQRIMQLGISEIKVADRLSSDNIVIVQMTSDVVDMAIAQGVTTVSWQSMGGMVDHYKVMAAWVPRVKADYEGHSGIAHIYDVTP